VLVTHVLLGLSLVSWSFNVAAPFGNSPQLAAITTTLLATGFAIIACIYSGVGTLEATIFSVVFPPGYYIFAIRAICGFEINLMVTDALKPDPDNGLMLLPLIIVAGVCVNVITVDSRTL
jgi:ATP-binding cassette, subfamily A (ABC1), member 3